MLSSNYGGIFNFLPEELNGLAVGRFLIYPLDNISCYIQAVLIFEKYQNNGYGTRMIQEAVEMIRNIRPIYQYAVLRVFADNSPAIKIYKKAGFKIKENQHDNRIYLMECNLQGGL